MKLYRDSYFGYALVDNLQISVYKCILTKDMD